MCFNQEGLCGCCTTFSKPHSISQTACVTEIITRCRAGLCFYCLGGWYWLWVSWMFSTTRYTELPHCFPFYRLWPLFYFYLPTMISILLSPWTGVEKGQCTLIYIKPWECTQVSCGSFLPVVPLPSIKFYCTINQLHRIISNAFLSLFSSVQK